MGNSKSKKTHTSSKVGKEFNCPFCNSSFPAQTTFFELNKHTIECANTHRNANLIQQENVNANRSNTTRGSSISLRSVVETSTKKTRESKSQRNVKKGSSLSFEQKLTAFRGELMKIKVDWRLTYCTLELNRQNILSESMARIQSIDLLKELKINFKGEVSYDAGGIIREWVNVLIQELESPELNLFEKGETNEFSYVINTNIERTYCNLKYFRFLGKILAKALVDNITVNLCFNKLIFKMLLEEEILYEDLIFIDKPLYNSLKELRSLDNLDDLCLYYQIDRMDARGNLVTDELIENGCSILVTDADDYVEKRIAYILMRNKIFIEEMKTGIYSVIPKKFFLNFYADELELVLCGRPFIDVDEWRSTSIYQGKFNAKHKVVNWFWETLFCLSQEDLGKFLQFCTGTSRVPIGGFAELESNRGEIAKFCLVPVPFEKKRTNFIKAHTCFNRIDLPLYLNQNQLREGISFIIKNEILGFGID